MTDHFQTVREALKLATDGPIVDRDGMMAQALAALAQIEAAVRAKLGVAQWKPISTAPKDGTPILLARDHRVTAGHWEPERYPTATEYHSTTGEYLGQFETGEVIDAWWYSEDGGFDEENPPTHWMQLPPPPIVGKEGA